MAEKKRKLKIEIDNLTEAQAIAIEDMMAIWVSLGSMGSSRWTCFFADGDGNFRPKIKLGSWRKREPKTTDLVSVDERWKTEICGINEAYKIDFDWIAWRLHGDGR